MNSSSVASSVLRIGEQQSLASGFSANVHNHGTIQNAISHIFNPQDFYIFELSSSFHVDWRLKSQF